MIYTFIYLFFSDLLFFVIGYNGTVSIFSLTMLFSTIMSLSQYDSCHSFKGFVKEETAKQMSPLFLKGNKQDVRQRKSIKGEETKYIL